MKTQNGEIMSLSRRSFLGWMAVGASEVLAPAIIRPAPKVFDLGRIRHAPRMAPAGSVIKSIRSGRWSDPRTWDLGMIPSIQSSIEIGHEVIMDSSFNACLVTAKDEAKLRGELDERRRDRLITTRNYFYGFRDGVPLQGLMGYNVSTGNSCWQCFRGSGVF